MRWIGRIALLCLALGGRLAAAEDAAPVPSAGDILALGEECKSAAAAGFEPCLQQQGIARYGPAFCEAFVQRGHAACAGAQNTAPAAIERCRTEVSLSAPGCYTRAASAAEDPALCERIRPHVSNAGLQADMVASCQARVRSQSQTASAAGARTSADCVGMDPLPQARCLTRIAIAVRDASGCEQVAPDARLLCRQAVAPAAGDRGLCLRGEPAELELSAPACLIAVAAAAKDVAICDEVVAFRRQGCVRRLQKSGQTDLSRCDHDETAKRSDDECRTRVAVATRRAELCPPGVTHCGAAVSKRYDTCPDEACRFLATVSNADLEGCARLADASESHSRSRCIREIAAARGDRALCAGSPERGDCEAYVDLVSFHDPALQAGGQRAGGVNVTSSMVPSLITLTAPASPTIRTSLR